MSWFEIASVFASLLSVMGGILMAVLLFMMRRTADDMDRIERTLSDHQTALSDHKIFSLNTFAKDVDVKSTFERLQNSIITLQQALNTNTNITGVILEKISTVSGRLDGFKQT